MRKTFLGLLAAFMIATFLITPAKVSAGGTSISIDPSSKVFRLSAGSSYDEILKVKNNGDSEINFEVYAMPYSFVYSEELGTYAANFSRETEYNKMVHWISIMDEDGNFASRPTFTADPGETVEVTYRITTPSTIPDGGQYAVLLVHAFSNSTGGGIHTEASPGMIIYGWSDGKAIISSEISDLNISQTIEKEITVKENDKNVKKNVTLNRINATAKVKNNGNIDFNVNVKLKVTGFLGNVYYETPEDKPKTSIIPEAELTVSDEWEEEPFFGLYNISWTVTVGDNTETTEITVFMASPSAIFLIIILLTTITIFIIIKIKKRKAPF